MIKPKLKHKRARNPMPQPPPYGPTNPYSPPHPPPYGPTNLNPTPYQPPPFGPTNLNPYGSTALEHPLIPGFGASKLAPNGSSTTGGGGGPAAPYPGFLNAAQLRAEAIREAALAYSPQRQEIIRQQQEANALAARQGQAIQGFALASANALKSAGPTVQAGYQGAAQDTASFGKGYSDGLRMLEGKAADQGNAYLTAVGGADAGTAPIQGDHGAADVLYGLGGVIPASTLEREGAAFGAAASAYPRTVLGQGRETQLKSIWDARNTNNQLNARLRDVAANQGGAVATDLFRLKQTEFQKRQYYGARADTKQARAAALASHRQDVATSQANRKEDIAYRNRVQADRVAAQKQAQAQQAAYQNQQAAQKDKYSEYLQGKLDQQTASDDASKAQAWTKINGFVSNADGSLVKGADGKPVPTAATQQFNLSTQRYYDTLDESNRHNKATESNTADANANTAAAKSQAAQDKKDKLKLPNPSLSRGKGYVVDSYGNPILGPDGKRQAYKSGGAGPKVDHAKVVKARDSYLSKMQKATISAGNSGKGKPIAAPLTPGAFVGKNGKPTRNPKLAALSGVKSYKQIFETVYAEYAPTLIHTYGYKDSQVRGIINARLRKLGYKPGKK